MAVRETSCSVTLARHTCSDYLCEILARFPLKSAKTVIVDMKVGAGRRERGCVSDLWEESQLKGHSAEIHTGSVVWFEDCTSYTKSIFLVINVLK